MRRTFIQARPSIPRDSMIPGGRVNPRQMRQAMKRLGIEQEELAGVEEVVIRTATKEYVIPDEDVKLVAEKAGVSEEDARKALEEAGGEPAEAIIRLMSR